MDRSTGGLPKNDQRQLARSPLMPPRTLLLRTLHCEQAAQTHSLTGPGAPKRRTLWLQNTDPKPPGVEPKARRERGGTGILKDHEPKTPELKSTERKQEEEND